MLSQYILEPTDRVAEACSKVGRFLEDDYTMAMSSSDISIAYSEQIPSTPNSDRKIVIVGAQSVPMATAKSAFLAQTLAKPEKLTIKAPSPDESLLIRESLEANKDKSHTEYYVYENRSEELASNAAWLTDLEEATDIVVFGGQETVSFFEKSNLQDTRLHLHGPKFSLGFVTADLLQDEDYLDAMIGDFLSYYGEGCLSPKFYTIVGSLDEDQLYYLKDSVESESDLIEEFRSKLPLSKKSIVVQQFTYSTFLSPHIRTSNFSTPEFLSSLFGDLRLVQINDPDSLESLVLSYKDSISTIAVEEDDLGDVVAGWDVDVPRYCDVGSMQFPYFYEKFDTVDDFEIYGGTNEA